VTYISFALFTTVHPPYRRQSEDADRIYIAPSSFVTIEWFSRKERVYTVTTNLEGLDLLPSIVVQNETRAQGFFQLRDWFEKESGMNLSDAE